MHVRTSTHVRITDENNIEILTVELSGVVVTSVYKPPGIPFNFKNPLTNPQNKKQIIIGDFNSHNTLWGYKETNTDGEALEEWMDANQLSLIHDLKQPKSFNSGRWKRGYNPDLAFADNSISGLCHKLVLDPVPRTQHRPIGIQVKAAITPTTVPFRRRFNYKKANWEGFSKDLDDEILKLEPSAENYNQFVKVVHKIARKNIPRGCRTNYIPGLTPESADIYETYKEMFAADPFAEETTSTGEKLISAISQEHRKSWQSLIESTDMTNNSKKAWSLIHKLGNDPKKAEQHYTTTANQVAHQLLMNGKSKRLIGQKAKPRLDRSKYETTNPGFTKSFTMEELETGITTLKAGKAAGLDNISTEQIKHFGRNTRLWLLNLYNSCMERLKIPKIWRHTRVVALLKPGKDPSLAKSFRPISLLCDTYKLFERLILNRLAPIVDEHLIPEQAGFRPGKSTTSQILNLTQHIEDGFERGQITGSVFVDLSAAYDTVNHRRLLSKFLDMTKDLHLTELIQTMLQNRRFFVELGGKRSRWRKQQNGLPQGSVLAPMMYNIYTNDQPIDNLTRRFIYADDLCITAQSTKFTEVETVLTEALAGLTSYYEENQLRANSAKTQVCAFHLRNKQASRHLNISWSGTRLEHCQNPVYLGVTLDRSLSFRAHVEKTKAKVCTRNNILSKLTNIKWGARPETLRTTAVALCFSAAEYACPAWERSPHAKKIDPALNASCRAITGCLRPTNTNSLYLLAGIAPPDIRRAVASRAERLRQTTDNRHPLHGHVPTPTRLKSRKSFLPSTTPLNTTATHARLQMWNDSLTAVPSTTKMDMPVTECLPPGAEEPWQKWKCLNRLRAGVGRSKVSLKKWGYTTGSTMCDCGTEPQTMQHLLHCPLLEDDCTVSDLATNTGKAQKCVKQWLTTV